jgi:hypothetical protein
MGEGRKEMTYFATWWRAHIYFGTERILEERKKMMRNQSTELNNIDNRTHFSGFYVLTSQSPRRINAQRRHMGWQGGQQARKMMHVK